MATGQSHLVLPVPSPAVLVGTTSASRASVLAGPEHQSVCTAGRPARTLALLAWHGQVFVPESHGRDNLPLPPDGNAGEAVAAGFPNPRPGLWAALIPAFLGLTGGLAVIAMVPPSLGTLCGGLAMATVMLPGLVAAQPRWLDRILAIVCFTIPLTATWLQLVNRDILHGGEWLLAALVLLTYGLAIGGLTCLLRMLRMPATAAAAGAVLAGVLWLSWPIWMAPWLSGPSGEKTVARLVAVHPAFALNGRLIRAFPVPWAQYRLAYDLTNIGDDIPYEMPRAIWPCVRLHLALGLCVFPWWAALPFGKRLVAAVVDRGCRPQ